MQGHFSADLEHERGRKEERRWAEATQDPILIFEAESLDSGAFTEVLRWPRSCRLCPALIPFCPPSSDCRPSSECRPHSEYSPASSDYARRRPNFSALILFSSALVVQLFRSLSDYICPSSDDVLSHPIILTLVANFYATLVFPTVFVCCLFAQEELDGAKKKAAAAVKAAVEYADASPPPPTDLAKARFACGGGWVGFGWVGLGYGRLG